jgi:hypothetical protein
MEHKFNPENKNNLFSEFRKKILPAHKTLKEAGLKAKILNRDLYRIIAIKK